MAKTAARTKATSAKRGKAAHKRAGGSKDASSARYRLFVAAYIANNRNGKDAAIAAGYSPKTAEAAASRLLRHVEIVALLKEKTEKIAQKVELTAEIVLKSLSQAIHFDPRKLLNGDGSVKAVHELDDDTAMALAGFEQVEEFQGRGAERELVGYTKKLKWLDKNAAREQAMKHLGLYREDNNQRNPLAEVPREALKALVDRLKGASV